MPDTEPLATAPRDPLRDLGVTTEAGGGTIRVWSASATGVEVCVFDGPDSDHVIERVPLDRGPDSVWSGFSSNLGIGATYTVRTDGPSGPTHRFDRDRHLLDPWSRGVVETRDGRLRSSVPDETFDWNGARHPRTPLDRTVVYEAHVKGFTMLNPAVPADLRGTYAGLAHASSIDYLLGLGVTAVEFLPVHRFTSEQRLTEQGRHNYWGYNTLNFFTPHEAYASPEARLAGPSGVLREFKGMVKLLHEAGIEVFLDVVFNHTGEEGPDGPTTSFRGLDNAHYYRQMPDGDYIDVTGCGNTLDFSREITQRLVLDSLRYWANEVQIDGFRFDLAPALGRDADVHFDAEHPLLAAIVADPALEGTTMIAEPWDVGMGGWQTGSFPTGWSEWNDGYRDRMRDFWLTDIAEERAHGAAPHGIGGMARRLAGSAQVFTRERGPLASVNFVTAHDGFTLADLTAYNQKHNLANGEGNRDGSDDNHSDNHGVEGPTDDPVVTEARRRTMRNLLGTLALSAGVPMITAGDEFGRSQHGNNNGYCHDNELTWLSWEHEPWQRDLAEVTATLLRLRKENPALRPKRFGVLGESTPSASTMDWFGPDGAAMSSENWDSPGSRTLQYLASSTPELEEFNRILLVVHGRTSPTSVVLPRHDGVSSYRLLWDSAASTAASGASVGGAAAHTWSPGDTREIPGVSIQLYRAE